MKGDIVIRLIDVVLILLFGFISISQVSRNSQIDLPKSTQIPLSNPDKEEILIINITKNGEYLVDDETRTINGDSLYNYIYQKKKLFEADEALIRVRIRSDRDAPARFTFDLATICDHLNIAKSIDVQRKGQ